MQQFDSAMEEVLLLFELVTPEERIAFLDKLAETYCLKCGSFTNGDRCHCTNDE